MKKSLLVILVSITLIGVILACNKDDSYLKSTYEVVLSYSKTEKHIIPLKILKNKTIVTTLDINNPFVINDGIYCSKDGYYLEGLCRFKDKDGGKWEMRFYGEPISKKGYSIFTVLIIKEEKNLQQNDFTFKGRPGDIMNMGVSPFSIVGLYTIRDNWFSLSLRVK